MDRDIFKNMDIEQQIQFVNNKLKEYNSFNKLCAGEKLPKSTTSERFKKHGYKFIDGQYRLIDNPVTAHADLHHDDNDVLNMINSLQREVSTLKHEINKLKSPIKSKLKGIDLVSFSGKTENRSFRIDSDILKNFNKFCKQNKTYKKQDLLSQAIHDFITKYK